MTQEDITTISRIIQNHNMRLLECRIDACKSILEEAPLAATPRIELSILERQRENYHRWIADMAKIRDEANEGRELTEA